jgi:hypothetical protein
VRKALGAALALAAMVLCAGAATPPSNSGPVDQALVQTAGLARFRLAASVDAFLAGLDPSSQATLGAFLRPGGDRASDGLWPSLMTGAVEVRQTRGDRAATLWFNPVFDAGLLIHWRRVAYEWRATDAAWVLGRDVRHQRPAPGRPMGFADLAQASLRAADASQLDAMVASPNAAAVTAARLSSAADLLARMYATPGYRFARLGARLVLALSDPAQLPARPELKRALALYGDGAREALRPVSAERRADGWSLVMQSPEAPGAAWIVHFSDPPAGLRARIVGVTLVDYAVKAAHA